MNEILVRTIEYVKTLRETINMFIGIIEAHHEVFRGLEKQYPESAATLKLRTLREKGEEIIAGYRAMARTAEDGGGLPDVDSD